MVAPKKVIRGPGSPARCPPTLPQKQRQRCRTRLGVSLQQQWLQQLAFGPDRQEAALVQLWLGFFPVHWRMLPRPELLLDQIATIRSQLHGSYTDLLTAMLGDPAFQVSLNGPSNRRGRPNENLGRELLELFSVGEGHYSERDVIETARALTGFRLTAEGLRLAPRRHDAGPKTILGRTAPFDLPALAEWLCEQPATARHISRRLWRRLVGEEPATAVLEDVASSWRRQNLSLPWLMGWLRSEHRARPPGRQLADPITVVARSLALLGSRHPDALAIARQHLPAMGQSLFEPPSVKGWPVNAEWLQVRWLQARRRGLLALLADEEVWAERRLPDQLDEALTPIPPLTLALPAAATRDNLAQLFTDPVWQLA